MSTGRGERRVLVVCTANRCRSPMAEGLIKKGCAAAGRPVDVASAGTWAEEGLPPTEHAVTVMAERHIDISSIRSREITAAAIAAADLILVMTRGHLEAIHTEFPASKGKVRLVSTLAGGAYDIADPVGGSLEDYRRTADELDRILAAGWSAIMGGATASSAR